MNLVGYGRVSTESQRENTSLATQKEAIHGYCKHYGHKLVAYYQDVESGSTIDERENLQWALQTVESVADGLLVFRLDRLTRSVYDGEWLKRDFVTKGKALLSVVDVVDIQSADGSFVFSINSAIAELERKRIHARCSKGREMKREAGGYIGGTPPYGYAAYRGSLIELPYEQAIITKIKDWYMQGWSIARIAQMLTDLKIPTKKRMKAGNIWRMETVRRIICGDPPLILKLRRLGLVLPASHWQALESESKAASQSQSASNYGCSVVNIQITDCALSGPDQNVI